MTSDSERILVADDEWYRIYRSATHSRIYESKFSTGEARISFREISRRWPLWNEGERVQFAQAFGRKHALDSEDDKILEFLMEQNNAGVAASIALLSTKHSDIRRAISFLTHGIEAFPRDRPNFLQAFSVLAAAGTELLLSRIYCELEANVVGDKCDPEEAISLLYASSALFKLTSDDKYEKTITRLLNQSDQGVRANARLCIEEIRMRRQ